MGEHGAKAAAQIIRFRLLHVQELLAVAHDEGLLQDSNCREVETFDVFHDKEYYADAKQHLSVYQRGMPVEGAGYSIYEGEDRLKVWESLPFRDTGADIIMLGSSAIF